MYDRGMMYQVQEDVEDIGGKSGLVDTDDAVDVNKAPGNVKGAKKTSKKKKF